MIKLKNILKEGDTFVDVGANIGLMSIFSSFLVRESGKVFSFEPNPITNNILKENIELNNLSNITISVAGKYSLATVGRLDNHPFPSCTDHLMFHQLLHLLRKARDAQAGDGSSDDPSETLDETVARYEWRESRRVGFA